MIDKTNIDFEYSISKIQEPIKGNTKEHIKHNTEKSIKVN